MWRCSKGMACTSSESGVRWAVITEASWSDDLRGAPRRGYPDGLPLCHLNLRASPGEPWSSARLSPSVRAEAVDTRPAFQSDLVRAVREPERFRGGFAPSAPPDSAPEDSPARGQQPLASLPAA